MQDEREMVMWTKMTGGQKGRHCTFKVSGYIKFGACS